MAEARRSALAVRELTVRYGATTALDAVDLEVVAGEIHAVVGENGAGKSTLLRAVMGLAPVDGGSIALGTGDRCGWAPQEPILPPDLNAAEWIFLGRERRRGGFLARRAMQVEANTALSRLGCAAPSDRPLRLLSPALRKQVQLAGALYGDPPVVLLDEPTAVLGDRDARALFAAVRRHTANGGSVVWVSHRIDEVLSLADTVTVLRDGRRVVTAPTATLDAAAIVRAMVGRDLLAAPPNTAPGRTEVLSLDRVSAEGVHAVSLTVRAGEIVGLAGLVGAGRSELLETIAGLQVASRGLIARAAAAALVPEDRAGKGLVATMNVRENICLPADGAFLDRRAEKDVARLWIDHLRIRASGTEAPVLSLSGGNQQKVLLARALRREPALLLLDEPTAGVDIGAKEEIHEFIRKLAAGGTAILMASSELTELLSLCHRIVALREGSIVGETPAALTTEAQLAAMITGAAA